MDKTTIFLHIFELSLSEWLPGSTTISQTVVNSKAENVSIYFLIFGLNQRNWGNAVFRSGIQL